MATGALALEGTRTDAADLVARKGDEHEFAYVDSLRAAGRDVVEIASEPGLNGFQRGADRTLEAMRARAEVIYQGVLFDGVRWRGYADFLERVETPSALGDWSYEVADTKLARLFSRNRLNVAVSRARGARMQPGIAARALSVGGAAKLVNALCLLVEMAIGEVNGGAADERCGT